jgi:DNA-directed RNA polymerase subunit RPC12/RpoP
MLLACTARCGGSTFRALLTPEHEVPLRVDTFGHVVEGEARETELLERVPLYVCERCGAPAANLSEARQPPPEESDRETWVYRCPECNYDVVTSMPITARAIVCPNCEGRYSPDVGLR